MRYDNLRKEELVLQDKHNILAKAVGDLIFYHKGEEKARWRDTEDIYPLTIQLLNAKTVEDRNTLTKKIEKSLTYKKFIDLCKQYPEE